MASFMKANMIASFSRLVLAFKAGTWQFGVNPPYRTLTHVRWVIAKHNEVQKEKHNAVQEAKHSDVQKAKQNEIQKVNKIFSQCFQMLLHFIILNPMKINMLI